VRPEFPGVMSEVSVGRMRPGVDAPRCLVVDDEPRLRQVLMRLMQSEGYACAEAGNGVEALAHLEHSPVSVLLSDLSMPEMDGVELLGFVRARYPDVAVVMITAVADVDAAVRCLALGAMDYLTKPFNIDEVRARVSKALEKRRLVMENRAYQTELECRVAEQARKLEELFLASVQSMAASLEVKDRYTHGHSLRVSRYAVATAQAMGLDGATLREIELGGHLHDIGKIGVREAVLNKEGPLTDEEYEHIMTHPVVGFKLLEPLIRDMPQALAVVRSHHERWDGRGLPDGLASESIPLAARIGAVADAFDAMTSVRPYRTSRTLEEGLAEVRRCAGSQFDPVVVAAFERAAAEGLIVLEVAEEAVA
jgi:putative two-component system response regulator